MVYAAFILGEDLHGQGYKRLMQRYAPEHLQSGIKFEQAIHVAHLDSPIQIDYHEGQLVRAHAPNHTFPELMNAVKEFLVDAAQHVRQDAIASLESRCFVNAQLLPQSLAFLSETTPAEMHEKGLDTSEVIQEKYLVRNGGVWKIGLSLSI